MPVTQLVPPTQSYIIPPKDTPSSPKRPLAEPVRPTIPPALIPDSPKHREKSCEPTIKPSSVAAKSPPPARRSPTPAATNTDSDPEPEEQDDDDDDADIPDTSKLALIDMETFTQILELDEDEESHDFSRPMVWEYFDQAERTFTEMDDAITGKDLPQLSALGHFLKGSSAALGLSRVQDSCEKIQHYGHQRDEMANKDLNPAEALVRITKTMKRVKLDYNEAKLWLKDFYGDEEA